jgi:hypothetical protein
MAAWLDASSGSMELPATISVPLIKSRLVISLISSLCPVVDEGRRNGSFTTGHHLNDQVGHFIHFDAAARTSSSADPW